MKKSILVAIAAASLCMSAPVFAADGGAKDGKASPAAKAPAKAAPAVKKADEPKMPTKVPADASKAIDLAKDTFNAGKAKNWWLMSAGIIWLLMFGMKIAKLFKKMGKRWAYLTVGIMSMAAMLAAKFGGGVSWEAAIAVLTSGPFMAFANDFVKRGILGKEPTTPINGGGNA